jgi:deferrochelatase/peroxidase EfeB
MVGRKRDGTPLIVPAIEKIEGGGDPKDLNAFTYRSDRDGLSCPLGAHIRRSNPRNADLPPGRADGSRGPSAPSASTPTRSPTTSSHRRAFTGCCAAAASTGPG